MRLYLMIGTLVAAAGLVACGGGDSTPVVGDREVPTSATASPTAFSQWAGSVAPEEGTEPLGTDMVVPPTSETDEPIAVS